MKLKKIKIVYDIKFEIVYELKGVNQVISIDTYLNY
jgi:hypothetical protein